MSGHPELPWHDSTETTPSLWKKSENKSRKKQEEGQDAPAGEVAALLLSEDVSGNKVVTERHLSIGTDYL